MRKRLSHSHWRGVRHLQNATETPGTATTDDVVEMLIGFAELMDRPLPPDTNAANIKERMAIVLHQLRGEKEEYVEGVGMVGPDMANTIAGVQSAAGRSLAMGHRRAVPGALPDSAVRGFKNPPRDPKVF